MDCNASNDVELTSTSTVSAARVACRLPPADLFYSLPLMHLLFQSAPASGYTSTGKCVRMKKKLKPEEEGVLAGDVTMNPMSEPE